jgi:ABC-2 type transport system ATP-binding protein
MISVEDVTVRFGDLTALDGLCLRVPKGQFFGLLGPNGAGKSTLIACIAGLRRPSSGEILVGGVDVVKDPKAVGARLGLVPQSLALFPDLSVVDNLATFAGIFGVPRARQRERVEWGLELAQLTSKRAARVEQLSGGMARRLNLACGLLHDPQLIICDEPTAGVDPQSRAHIFETLKTLHSEGRTIVYTTHYMEEVEALCDQVVIMDHGRVIADDSLEKLLEAPREGRHFTLELAEASRLEELREALGRAQLELRALGPPTRRLEELFLERTGRSLRDGPASAREERDRA